LKYLLKFNPAKMLKTMKTRAVFLCKCCGAKMKIIATRIKQKASPQKVIVAKQ